MNGGDVNKYPCSSLGLPTLGLCKFGIDTFLQRLHRASERIRYETNVASGWYVFFRVLRMNLYRSKLEPELLPYYNEINETIRVIPAGKHVTTENLEEKPVEIVLDHGYYVNEKGLVILKSEAFDQQEM
jgi:hypothetical protein